MKNFQTETSFLQTNQSRTEAEAKEVCVVPTESGLFRTHCQE